MTVLIPTSGYRGPTAIPIGATAPTRPSIATRAKVPSEPLVALYERSIVPAENEQLDLPFGDFLRSACRRTLAAHAEERDADGFGKAPLETRSRSSASRSPTSPTSRARARARWSARSEATSTA